MGNARARGTYAERKAQALESVHAAGFRHRQERAERTLTPSETLASLYATLLAQRFTRVTEKQKLRAEKRAEKKQSKARRAQRENNAD